MILPDVNVLIYAFRADSSHHAICNSWLNDVVAGDSSFGISPLALGALIRITTTAKVFPNPSRPGEAFAFADHLLRHPLCQIVEPGPRHWSIFQRLCLETETRAGRVTDAWYAALAIEWGCEWITFDRDYARFPGLKWGTPGSPPT